MDNLKTISEGLSAILGLVGVFIFGYILLMGIIHKWGKTNWVKKERDRRTLQGKPNINLISGDTKAELPWKDPSLIQGGYTALGLVSSLLSYVAAMLLFFAIALDGVPIAPEVLGKVVGILMAWPVVMGAGTVLTDTKSIIDKYKLPTASFYFLIVIALIIAVLSIFIFMRSESYQLALGVQLILFLVVSCLISYVIGTRNGIEAAEIETRFPLVSVVTTQGNTIDRLRLYEKTDSDYRFIGEDGTDYILPGLHIAQIKHVPEKINTKAS